MIERSLVRQVVVITGLISVAAALLTQACGGSKSFSVGFLAGAGMGLLPIVTWAAMVGPMVRRGSGILVAIIMLGKLAIYGVLLVALVGGGRVNPLAFGGALLMPSFVMAWILLTRPEGAQA